MMNKYLTAVGAATTIIVTIFIVAIISGTILWGTWDVVPVFFPTLAKSLPVDPTWWMFVKVSWLVTTIARLFIPNIKVKNE